MELAIYKNETVTVPGPYKSIADIRAANIDNGGHWFDRSTMAFFESRIESSVYAGRFFISSEQPPHGPRLYGLRVALDNGNIDTIKPPDGMASDLNDWFRNIEDARAYARKLSRA